MAFSVPQFPMVAAIYTADTVEGGPPRLLAPCNIAVGQGVLVLGSVSGYDDIEYFVRALLPAGTDVRDDKGASEFPDALECPAGSGRFYVVMCVNDVGQGFSNEHRMALVVKAGVWPEPLPPVFVVPGPVEGGGGVVARVPAASPFPADVFRLTRRVRRGRTSLDE